MRNKNQDREPLGRAVGAGLRPWAGLGGRWCGPQGAGGHQSRQVRHRGRGIGSTPSSAATRSMTWPGVARSPAHLAGPAAPQPRGRPAAPAPGRQAAHASGLAQARGGGGRRDVRQGRRHAAARAEPAQPLALGAQLRSSDVLRTGEQASVSVRFADGSRLLVPPGSEVQLESLLVLGRAAAAGRGAARAAGWGREPGRAQPAPAPMKYEVRTPSSTSACAAPSSASGGRRSPVGGGGCRPCACHRRGGRPRARRGLGGRRRRPAACAAAARARRGRRAARRRAPAAALSWAPGTDSAWRAQIFARGLQSPASMRESSSPKSPGPATRPCRWRLHAAPARHRCRRPGGRSCRWISACRRGLSRPSSACRRLTPWSTPGPGAGLDAQCRGPARAPADCAGRRIPGPGPAAPTHRRREPRRQPAAGRLPLAHCFGGRRARLAFGDAQRFELREPPPARPGDARRQWQPTGPALAGRVWRGGLRTGWATNAGFEGAVTHKTDKPELTLPKPAPGRYYLRARSRNADGINSPWGQTS